MKIELEMLNLFQWKFSTIGAYVPLFAVQPRKTVLSIESSLRTARMMFPPPLPQIEPNVETP